MLAKLCREYTELSDTDIATLENFAATLPSICKLVNSDIFIDCFYENGTKSLVVAEARPPGTSVYKESVVGKHALRKKEPAVFRAMETGFPARDILGITQENKTVWQVVIPIKNAAEKVIGVLIQEKDISARLSRDKKYDRLVQIAERQKEKLHRLNDAGISFMPGMDDNRLVMKEIHHRVKNNLQLVASMLNLQARKAETPEIRTAFWENVNRILSIASVYDTLSLDNDACDPGQEVLLLPILRKICDNVTSFSQDGGCRISVVVEGEDFSVDHDKATYIAIVVNELVMNAVEHAFIGRTSGAIQVAVKRGNQYSSVSVSDNGIGFPVDRRDPPQSLGMDIVRSLVTEKLRGQFHIESGDRGSAFSIDFLDPRK